MIISMMNPRISSVTLSILTGWTLLVSTCCRLGHAYQTQFLLTPIQLKNAAENDSQLPKYFPSSEAQTFQPISPFPSLQSHPPFYAYPPSPSRSPPLSPPHGRPEHRVWCVARPTVPVSLLQQALDYACASGADCRPIQLREACYLPDSVLAHASYAFNSYWQRTKRAGGTCDFGGSAMLVTVDPSYDECHFIYS